MKPANRVKDLSLHLGGLSKPKKMPGFGYSYRHTVCKMGAKLRHIPGSVCSRGYCQHGHYCFPDVKQCLEHRHAVLMNDPEAWRQLMTELIFMKNASTRKRDGNYFRWHDSADFQGAWHIKLCNEIANDLPHIEFWAPTKEEEMVMEFIEHHELAPNFIVRVSMPMIFDGPNPLCDEVPWTSTVCSEEGFECPAFSHAEYECEDCRACWDKNVPNIDYHLHW